MHILIAGRLGRYADRVLALRDLGHELVYVNMPAPRQKPLPDDIGDPSVPQFATTRGRAGALVRELVERYAVDVIYSLKNVWDGSLELLEEILDERLGVPVVRHYKEHFCTPSALERRSLVETDGQIYINEESYAYFRSLYGVRADTAHILDTDYLPARYMTDDFRPKAYGEDRRPHLLMAGGASSNGGRNDVRELCRLLAAQAVAFHIYGEKYVGPDTSGVWGVGHEPARRDYERLAAQGCVSLHPHVDPPDYVRSWSPYDAGLMHHAMPGRDAFAPFNHPNRMTPYLAAGLPLAQQVGEHRAMERLVEREGVGFLYGDTAELAAVLRDRARIAELTARVVERRHAFTYEQRAPELLDVLSGYARGR